MEEYTQAHAQSESMKYRFGTSEMFFQQIAFKIELDLIKIV